MTQSFQFVCTYVHVYMIYTHVHTYTHTNIERQRDFSSLTSLPSERKGQFQSSLQFKRFPSSGLSVGLFSMHWPCLCAFFFSLTFLLLCNDKKKVQRNSHSLPFQKCNFIPHDGHLHGRLSMAALSGGGLQVSFLSIFLSCIITHWIQQVFFMCFLK